jgi:hypothetical protein
MLIPNIGVCKRAFGVLTHKCSPSRCVQESLWCIDTRSAVRPLFDCNKRLTRFTRVTSLVHLICLADKITKKIFMKHSMKILMKYSQSSVDAERHT